jgi:outer membrane receptor protein involved in Fe transport
MGLVRSRLLLACAFLALAGVAAAQTTNGTISGHVSDSQGLALPGVTVTATSPNLQGSRPAVTAENGDYVIPLLPPGFYTVTFELTNFTKVQKVDILGPTKTLTVDAQLAPGEVSVTLTVTAPSVDVLVQTNTVAMNFGQRLIETLPTNRDISSPLLMAPGVHPSGPNGAYSISGATSFESLFLVNGVTVNDNVRGQPNNLYIEDAIQETTVATAGISAEFGRFSGGVVNVVTKSGGNLFSGSLRDSLANDNWRALTSLPSGASIPGDRTQTVPTATVAADSPYPGDVKFNHVVPTYEYTFGGPVVRDRLWFFTAGRFQDQIANRQTFVTNIPYTFTQSEKRYEGNATYSPNSNHRVYGAFTKILLDQLNQSQQSVMDLTSLYNASVPQDLFTLSYSGVLSPRLFVEARYNSRHFTGQGAGSPFKDVINGTLLIDLSKGGSAFRYWTSTFCGTCPPQKLDADDVFLKGSYFLTKKNGGSHTMVFGYDTFNDKRQVDNYQSGSNYRIAGTGTIIRGTDIFPRFLNSNTQLVYQPLPLSSLGTNFRIHSVFYNDSWRASDHFTVNAGIRWDKNHGENSLGTLTANDSALSPRIGVVFDPNGDGKWAITASFGKYVAAVANTIADASSSAGNTASYAWNYTGPQINVDTTTASPVTSAAAIQTVLDWCRPDAQGVCTGPTVPTPARTVPGISRTIPGSLESPHALEYAAGISRHFGSRATTRADFIYRDFRDFYSERIDTNTGIAVDSLGGRFDKSVVENTNDLKRRYTGVTLSATYRPSARTDVGGNYTVSRLWGNFDGENLGSGPLPTSAFQYPEYAQASWNYPEGDLSADQRHRSVVWANYGVPKLNGLTVSVLETMASGLPYGAVGTVNVAPFVSNPGYLTPLSGTVNKSYYFTARDAFRTEASYRTDLSATYTYSLGLGAAPHRVDVFVQAVVVNLFNQFDLCGCGATSVFGNGGADLSTRIGQAILTNSGTPSLAAFNPLTTVPVQGVNWNYGPGFGTATIKSAFTMPRTFRLSMGVRF